MHMCVHVCHGACDCACMWKTEVEVRCPAPSLSILSLNLELGWDPRALELVLMASPSSTVLGLFMATSNFFHGC